MFVILYADSNMWWLTSEFLSPGDESIAFSTPVYDSLVVLSL